MKAKQKQVVGWTLISFGLLVVVFSNKIVFPGLERLLGIETIVGSGNVVYQDDGGYLFTNPGAMMRWILSVAAAGVVICASGIWLLFRAQKVSHNA
jgi:hypothetical protein